MLLTNAWNTSLFVQVVVNPQSAVAGAGAHTARMSQHIRCSRGLSKGPLRSAAVHWQVWYERRANTVKSGTIACSYK